jgi:hypothetical protein
MRDWLLQDLQALASTACSSPSSVIPKQRQRPPKQTPPDFSGIMASTSNHLHRCGRLGSAVMRLPATADTRNAIEYMRTCGVSEEEADSDRVVSALVVSCSAV